MRLLVLACVLVAAPTFAQVVTTGPVPAGAKLQYTAPANIPTAAEALTFEARLSRNGIPLTGASATSGLTCVSETTRIVCRWALTASQLDALNQAGVHNLTVSLFRADVGESVPSAPFALKSAAGAPTTVQVIP